jgi:hypothetical protein
MQHDGDGPEALVHELLESELSHTLKKFLASRHQTAMILSPEFVRAEVLAQTPACSASWMPLGAQLAPDDIRGKNVYVLAGDRSVEHSIMERSRTVGGVRFFSLLDHILPAIVANSDLFAEPTTPIEKYALLSIPRTGSTYLCALLTNHGLGAPLEHLRDPLARTIHGQLPNFLACMTALERYGSRNNIFGTKLISHFLQRAARYDLNIVSSFVNALYEVGYKLFYIRRNFRECVVSSIVASLADTWHVYDARRTEELRQAVDRKRLTPQMILGWVSDLMIQQITLDLSVYNLPVTNLDYSDIVARPTACVDAIRANLRMKELDKERALMGIPQPMREHLDIYCEIEDEVRLLISANRSALVDRVEKYLVSAATFEKQVDKTKWMSERLAALGLPR